MGMLFDLGLEEKIAAIRDRLRERFKLPLLAPTREPIGALIKSIISCRTYDEVSLRAFNNLIAHYPDWSGMAASPTLAIEAAIAEVTLAERVAGYVSQALRRIALTHPDYDLGFLKHETVPKALAWLERLPGVGRKVSAATLNFSTLHMPALVIDTHVLRVSQRLRLISAGSDTRTAYEQMMTGLENLTASDLSELHNLLKVLGQTCCHAGQPDCQACPLKSQCGAMMADVAQRWRG